MNTFYSKGTVLPFTVFCVFTVKSKTIKYCDFSCIYNIDCFTVEEKKYCDFNCIYIQKTVKHVFLCIVCNTVL